MVLLEDDLDVLDRLVELPLRRRLRDRRLGQRGQLAVVIAPDGHRARHERDHREACAESVLRSHGWGLTANAGPPGDRVAPVMTGVGGRGIARVTARGTMARP